jgi:N utilization substance protein B
MTSAPGGAGTARHHAREAALQMLYQWEIGRAAVDDVLRSYWASAGRDLSARARAFADALLRGTVAAVAEIDARVAAHAQHWRLERMAVVDRAILRLAVHELQQGDVPPKVVINEALELARTFSTEEAVRFVNGVLDAVRRGMDDQGRVTSNE